MKILLSVFRELKPYAEGIGLKLAIENLSYAASGYGKNVAEFEEIFNAINGESMGFTLDFCHATASGTTYSLLEKYHERLCNIHMSNRAHKPFSAMTPELEAFASKLKDYGYDGPVTLELNRKCTPAEFMQTKAVVEKALRGTIQPKS
jgi:sugar phosphate isomerase/epimerase